MNYVKSCLLITMLLGIGYGQDCDPEASVGWNCDCNEDTWQEYYNSENHIMDGCYLFEANLGGEHLYEADLSYANLGGAHLYEANLSFANLSGASLFLANLEGANLFAANLCNLAGSTWGECEESVTDNNGDGYDDVSYEVGYETGATSGDLNLDGIDNVLDVVILVSNILNP